MTAIAFDAPDLARAVEALSAAEIDRLPFGVIRLDPGGAVVVYNAAERAQSGWKKRPAVGLNFFLEIAPCMGTDAFKGRIEAARQQGGIDIEIGWIGDFDDPDRALTARVLSASDKGLWIFLRRDG